MMTLNINEDMVMALNAEIENITLNVKLRGDNGSECQCERNMALNAKTENGQWL